MDKQFTKLSELVGSNFTVESVGAFVWKRWDTELKKMVMSHSFEPGYRKMYPVTTDRGIMDLGPGQLGNLLEAVFSEGKADLIGRTFYVKSNGKTGMEIRYFFNPVKDGVDDLPPDEEPSW